MKKILQRIFHLVAFSEISFVTADYVRTEFEELAEVILRMARIKLRLTVKHYRRLHINSSFADNSHAANYLSYGFAACGIWPHCAGADGHRTDEYRAISAYRRQEETERERQAAMVENRTQQYLQFIFLYEKRQPGTAVWIKNK